MTKMLQTLMPKILISEVIITIFSFFMLIVQVFGIFEEEMRKGIPEDKARKNAGKDKAVSIYAGLTGFMLITTIITLIVSIWI